MARPRANQYTGSALVRGGVVSWLAAICILIALVVWGRLSRSPAAPPRFRARPILRRERSSISNDRDMDDTSEDTDPQSTTTSDSSRLRVPCLERASTECEDVEAGGGAVLLHHPRKSGGTAVRMALYALNDTYNFRFQEMEFGVFPTDCLRADRHPPSTRFVTVVRDPVQRWYSEFFYSGPRARVGAEGAQGEQHDLDHEGDTHKLTEQFRRWMDTGHQKMAAGELQLFQPSWYIDNALVRSLTGSCQEDRRTRPSGHHRRLMVQEEKDISSPLIASGLRCKTPSFRWKDLPGCPKVAPPGQPVCTLGRAWRGGCFLNDKVQVNQDDLAVAKTVIASFDAVLLTEWLGHASTRDFLARSLGVPVDSVTISQVNVVGATAESHTNTPIPEAVVNMLQADNALDMELYRYAKRLATARMTAANIAVPG